MRYHVATSTFSKLAGVALIVFGLASSTLAQGTLKTAASRHSVPVSPLRTPPAPPGQLANISDAPQPQKHFGLFKGKLRAWVVLGLMQHGAAFFDARTTHDAMNHYREVDPFIRPFAHSAALYPVMQIAPLGLDWLATRMATSRNRWLRRIWWLPQAASTAGFLWSGVHNLRLPGR